MILQKYGIGLRSLAASDLEMVRLKRNSDTVRQKMLYRKIISEEEQILWYESLNPISDFYFIIESGEHACGLINVRNIDHNSGSSESGLFIWDEKLLQSHIPVLASWLLSEAGYGIMGGPNTQIRVLKENRAAIEFNKKIGYETVKEENEIVFMIQSKISFSAATKKSRDRFLHGLKKDHSLEITFYDHENDSILIEQFLSAKKKTGISIEKHGLANYSVFIDF